MEQKRPDQKQNPAGSKPQDSQRQTAGGRPSEQQRSPGSDKEQPDRGSDRSSSGGQNAPRHQGDR